MTHITLALFLSSSLKSREFVGVLLCFCFCFIFDSYLQAWVSLWLLQVSLTNFH